MRAATVTAAIAALVLVAPAGAGAACSSSTPAAQSFADEPFDGELGLAPEITGVDVALGAACDVVVQTRLGDRSETAGLIRDETVTTYIDVDGNAATGSPAWGGADKAVLVVGQNGDDLPPALGTWTGSDFSFTAGVTLPVVGAGGFAATLDQLGVAAPATIGLRVATAWSGLVDTYDDLSPESGAPSHGFAVTFIAGAQPPPAPVVTAAPPPLAPRAASRRRCTVPNVRRLPSQTARRRLARAGCRYRLVRVRSRLRAGRVVSTSPPAGTRTRRTVVVRVAAQRSA